MIVVFRSVVRTFLAVTIALGVTPPAISLFELVQTPLVRIVALTRRRHVDYSAFFRIDGDIE
jgi:hypothetical protein